MYRLLTTTHWFKGEYIYYSEYFAESQDRNLKRPGQTAKTVFDFPQSKTAFRNKLILSPLKPAVAVFIRGDSLQLLKYL